MSEKDLVKVRDLKPGMENVNLEVRVIETSEPKTIQTRKGVRTISEAIIGDDTGRVRATLWGRKAGTLHEGEAVRIEGAWTTSYRGRVVVNIGSRTQVKEVKNDSIPLSDEIPYLEPKAPRARRQSRRRGQEPYYVRPKK